MKQKPVPKPVVLIILDGWGVAPAGPGNAISLSRTPNIDRFEALYPHGQLEASGGAVGLPKGAEGNSEVGHLNLGAGKIVYQDLPRINMAIADGSFLQNSAFLRACNHVRENKSVLHLMGLVSSGGVHSHQDHLYALLWFCKQQGFSGDQVKIHVFTDGRDTSPNASSKEIPQLEQEIANIGVGVIATVSGRYYAMDRDNRWDRIQKAYDVLADATGEIAGSAIEAIERSYKQGRTDEFIIPTVICDKNGLPKGKISDNDAVIFFNFRPDRARQLTQAFTIVNFKTVLVTRSETDPNHREIYSILEKEKKVEIPTFNRKTFVKNLFFVSMTEYQSDLLVTAIAFLPFDIPLPLARVLSEQGLHQFHISETEKYAHVTYFFNGRRETPFPGEDRLLVPSPKVATYDLQPEMNSSKVTDMLLSRLAIGIYDFAVVNYPNLDMIGHTGILTAAIKAVETVDYHLGKVVNHIHQLGGACIITADHGNVEELITPGTGDPHTEHTSNPVPVIITSPDQDSQISNQVIRQGILADVAPTILELMGVQKPSEMTGRNLLS